jgi:hypothetical protein
MPFAVNSKMMMGKFRVNQNRRRKKFRVKRSPMARKQRSGNLLLGWMKKISSRIWLQQQQQQRRRRLHLMLP